jgi:hypothetical protein
LWRFGEQCEILLLVANLTRLSFISRGLLVKKFGLDDFFIGVAMVSNGQRVWSRLTDPGKMLGGLQTTTLFMQIAYGTGRHSKELHLDGFNEMLKVGKYGPTI